MTTLRGRIEQLFHDYGLYGYQHTQLIPDILSAIKEALPEKKQSHQRFYSGHNAGFTEAIEEMEKRLGI